MQRELYLLISQLLATLSHRRRNSLARGDQQLHDVDPFVKRHIRPFNICTCTNVKILLASIAAKISTFAKRDAVGKAASGAFHSIGPEARLKLLACRLVIPEHLEKLKCPER